MGSAVFLTAQRGDNAEEAFFEAVRRAKYDYGHAGYTGTIAEKDAYVVIPLPEGEDAIEFANRLIEDYDPRIDDKWGPAGCIPLNPTEFLFFGWASC
jgi:hypothetical protein